MSAGLWNAYEAAAATGGALCARGGDPDRWIGEEWTADGVSIDSRSLAPGELFVALSDVRDGHDFVSAAFERGAAAALVSRAPADTPAGAPLLVVHDPLEGLRDLARAARRRNFAKRIAVTGSVGKTSTKEMLRSACAVLGRTHAADKSFNNHWGVPLTLARMPIDTDFGVFEIGMNHAGEITPLTRLVQPHVAIVTTVAAAHLEFFGTIEKIAEAKAEIFLGVAPGGAAIVPADNAHYGLLRRRAEEAGIARIISFGESERADFRLVDYQASGADAEAIFVADGRRHVLSLAAPGRHQAINALAVVAAIAALGQPLSAALAGLKGHAPAEGRGQQIPIRLPQGGEAMLLDESYNANPASMRAAIDLLGLLQPAPGGRRIAILGDMLELGPDGPALHASLADALVAAKVDRLYAAGALIEHLWNAVPAAMRGERAAAAGALAPLAIAALTPGDVVMVKGSNGSKVHEIVRSLKGGAKNHQ